MAKPTDARTPAPTPAQQQLRDDDRADYEQHHDPATLDAVLQQREDAQAHAAPVRQSGQWWHRQHA